jgi:hypothetical protein
MACVSYPDDASFEDCPPVGTISVSNHLEEAWGGPPFADSWCSWYATAVCGPEAVRPDACCYVFEDLDVSCATPGRPFRVDGQARTAASGSAADWSVETPLTLRGLSRSQRRKVAQHWAEAGRAEHASVAAFSRFASELLALGAPAGLVAEATRAMADEIHHARLCFGIASAAAGTQLSVGGIDVAGSLAEVTAERVLIDTILEGCVNETICAAQAEAALTHTTEPTVRAALSQIVEDEQRHATLAWKTVRWILQTRPDLVDLAHRTFTQAISGPTPTCSTADDNKLSTYGIQSQPDDAATARRVIQEVIEPCARALLQKEGPSRGAVA